MAWTITERTGDLFAAAPNNAILIHACNAQGSWGGGIAAIFKKKYPLAYKMQLSHCKRHAGPANNSRQLVGTALFIPPQEVNQNQDDARPFHFIGCLFTSHRFGRGKDGPQDILAATTPAMMQLIADINEWNATHEDDKKVKSIYMCKINSKLFNVRWESTKAALGVLGASVEGVEPVIHVVDLA
jgi:ADP-ribose 1''-phosphate phosphatase